MKGISSGCVVIVQILCDQIKLVNDTSVCESTPQGTASWLNVCNEAIGWNSVKNVGDVNMCGWRECRRIHTTEKRFPPGSVLHSNDAQRKQLLLSLRLNPNSVSEQSGNWLTLAKMCTSRSATTDFMTQDSSSLPPGRSHLQWEPLRLFTLKGLSKQKKLCACVRTCAHEHTQTFKQ